MINDITLNSNNAIELSRGQLLNWINDLLKISLVKIEQLGTGAAYCQLFDVLYPGKLPLSKVNFKAKFQNEFIINLKVLQQAFIKTGILRPIEIEKIVKCKYQDNLQFLQWFKKIYDINGLSQREEFKPKEQFYSSRRRDMEQIMRRDSDWDRKKGTPSIPKHASKEEPVNHQHSQRTSVSESLECSAIQPIPETQKVTPLLSSQMQADIFFEERQFYVRKFKEIEHLMEDWDPSRRSTQLIEQIRRVILVAPAVDWRVQDSEFIDNAAP